MPNLFFGTSGPRDAPIAIVGESWGAEEAREQKPFVGSSGQELRRMLLEAGIDPASCFMSNCASVQPKGNETWGLFYTNQEAKALQLKPFKGLFPKPEMLLELSRLYHQLKLVNPKVVIATGNYPLWALTDGCCWVSSKSLGNGATVNVPSGIVSWRGSMLLSNSIPEISDAKVLPIIHPAAILRAWYQRACTIHDLRVRVSFAQSGDWRPSSPADILAPPSFDRARSQLEAWLSRLESGYSFRLVCDLEWARNCLTCCGLTDSNQFAMSIPFVRLTAGFQFESYWSLAEETVLVSLIRRLLLHPNLLLEGQNFLSDIQQLSHFWGIRPRLDFDTMLAHHLLFPGTPKGLDYLSSLYVKYHWYWKEDNNEWDIRHQGLEQHLAYNAIDLIRQFECGTALRAAIIDEGMAELWEWEKRKHELALRMMWRGVAIDRSRRARVGFELMAKLQDIHLELSKIAPVNVAHECVQKPDKPWFASPKQTAFLFYEILGFPLQRNHKTKAPTTDDEALVNLSKKVPEFKKLFGLLQSERSIDVYNSTFVKAPLDEDNRMHCTFKPAGTETFRWSSSETIRGVGTNLQNIPKGTEKD